MKRIWLIMIGVLLLGALGLAIGLPMRSVAQVRDPKPTLIPLRVQTPAPTPPDDRQIAILTLVIQSNPEGELEQIILEQGRVIKSYAPNVFDRTGQWTVELLGNEEMRFGIQDPRWREAFPSGERNQFESELITDLLWELVVPLYYYEKDLGVEVIRIYDQRGEPIFSVEVDREGWK